MKPLASALFAVLFLSISYPVGAQLDATCTVAALNRSARVPADGAWVLPNVPSNLGSVRIRATCVENGISRSGQSDFLTIPANGVLRVPEIAFDNPRPISTRLFLSAPTTTLGNVGQTLQLTATGVLTDGATADLTASATGTGYATSNPRIATITPEGLVIAQASGTVVISAVNEGTLGLIRLTVNLSNDSDGDGLPDDFELAFGLDPADPLDAFADLDADALTNLAEFQLGTSPRDPDTDADTLLDGEEGTYGTHPLLFDTDGDGLSDGLEIRTGSDPLDPASYNLAVALAGFTVTPASFDLVYNTLLGEASVQLTVTGELIDGNTLDLTATRAARATGLRTSRCATSASSRVGSSPAATVRARSRSPTAVSPHRSPARCVCSHPRRSVFSPSLVLRTTSRSRVISPTSPRAQRASS
ncbi:MAG: hypothetical protein HC897_14105, partial [Thermoanaerobaculia bacterium]|nr:hypothetical protein [Thermoanaerobaculia bacterium]